MNFKHLLEIWFLDIFEYQYLPPTNFYYEHRIVSRLCSKL